MARFQPWQWMLLLFPVLIVFHLRVAPYTKVEESFNMQATHDIITYGIPTSNLNLKFKTLFDHMDFPGAVPRTFVGAVLLAGIAQPILWVTSICDSQTLVRAILGLFNAWALVVYTLGVRSAFGRGTAVWYIALQASQFHIIFYASRTLPNMFAFGLSTLALRSLLPDSTALNKIRRTRLAIYLLTLSAVIFRSELALLLACHCLFMLVKAPTIQARTSLIRTTFIPAALSGGIAGLILTVPVDTYFWQSSTLLWPELTAFISNIFPHQKGRGASAWGTSPWYWYFSSALPRLMMNPFILPLMFIALAVKAIRPAARDLLIPNLAYVVLYSLLPHKETRFLFPIVPPLTTAAALAAAHIQNRLPRSGRATNMFYCITFLATVTTFVVSHFLLLPFSALTYPGAIALNKLHHYATVPESPTHLQRQIHIHLDNLALQTGITRFLQHPLPASEVLYFSPSNDPPHTDGRSRRSSNTIWIYDKSENTTAKLTPEFWQHFDYVVAEHPARVIGAWQIVETVYTLDPRVVRVVQPGQARQRRGDATVADDSAAEAKTQSAVHPAEPIAHTTADKQTHDNPQPIPPRHENVRHTYAYGPAESVLRAWDLAGDILRDGKYFPSMTPSWTRGWWVEPVMLERLYILRRTESGVGT